MALKSKENSLEACNHYEWLKNPQNKKWNSLIRPTELLNFCFTAISFFCGFVLFVTCKI